MLAEDKGLKDLNALVAGIWNDKTSDQSFFFYNDETIRFPSLKVIREDTKKGNWIIAERTDDRSYEKTLALYPKPELAGLFYSSPRREKGPGDIFPGAAIAMKMSRIRIYSEIEYVQYLFQYSDDNSILSFDLTNRKPLDEGYSIPYDIKRRFRGFRYTLVQVGLQELKKEGITRVLFEYDITNPKEKGRVHDVNTALINEGFDLKISEINEVYSSIDANLKV